MRCGGEEGTCLRRLKQGTCVALGDGTGGPQEGAGHQEAAVPSAELGMPRKGLVWENGR